MRSQSVPVCYLRMIVHLHLSMVHIKELLFFSFSQSKILAHFLFLIMLKYFSLQSWWEVEPGQDITSQLSMIAII